MLAVDNDSHTAGWICGLLDIESLQSIERLLFLRSPSHHSVFDSLTSDMQTTSGMLETSPDDVEETTSNGLEDNKLYLTKVHITDFLPFAVTLTVVSLSC